MPNYELIILKYEDNSIKYVLRSYQIGKDVEQYKSNNIMESKNRYELKIKLDLLNLHFKSITGDNIEIWDYQSPNCKKCKVFDLCQITKYMN